LSDYGDHSEDLVRRLLSHLTALYTFGFESAGVASQPSKLAIQCVRPGSKVRSHPNVPAAK